MSSTIFSRLRSGLDSTGSWQPIAPSRMMLIDWHLIICVAVLVLFGCVMVFSASISLATEGRTQNSFSFLQRQAVYSILGAVTMLLVLRVPLRLWQSYAGLAFLAGLALLILVLLPGVGQRINGAYRWINLKVFTIQPAEIMKFCVLLYAADFVVRKQDFMKRLTRGFLPLGLAVSIVGALVMLQPDLGSLLVIVIIAMSILFLGRFNLLWMSSMGIILGVVFTSIVWFSPWRRERLFAFLNPWDPDYALDKGYQLTHSLIAFGRGELTGVGLGNSIEKLNYLPEAHTDFIIAIIAEEFGLMGVAFVIALFAWLVFRAFQIGKQADWVGLFFGSLLARGIGLWLGFQAAFNLGVASGALPTKGLTMPFISYGGSSLIVSMAAVALLLRVDFEVRQKLTKGSMRTTPARNSGTTPVRSA